MYSKISSKTLEARLKDFSDRLIAALDKRNAENAPIAVSDGSAAQRVSVA